MARAENARTDLPDILPVFPLPNTVLFPFTLLPLHIFEPRYREMVRDVKDGNGLIVIARMVGEGFDEIGTVGRMRDLVRLEDGRFNLMLEGIERVRVVEKPCETPYRQVRVEARPEVLGAEDPQVIEQLKLELLGTLGILLNAAKARVPVVLGQDLPFEVLVNKACAGLPVEASERQRLLVEDDLVGRHRRVTEHLADLIETLAPTGGAQRDGGTLLN